MKILGRGRYFVVSSYLQQLQSYLKQLDIPPLVLLENSDLPLLVLSQGNLFLGHESVSAVNAHMCQLAPSQTDLIYHLAHERDAMSHGSLGAAALLSTDLSDAVSLIGKYVKTRYSGIETKIEIKPQLVRVSIAVPTTNPLSDRLTVLSTLLMLENTLRNSVVLEQDDFDVKIGVVYSPPSDWQVRDLGQGLSFKQATNFIEFPRRLLDKSLKFSNKKEFEQAFNACDEELRLVNSCNNLSELIMRKLAQASLPLPTIDTIAESLNLSARTLRRRLEGEGKQYLDLKLETMNIRAIELLKHSNESLQRSSARLGYSDYKSFARAFKKANGITPSQYKKSN